MYIKAILAFIKTKMKREARIVGVLLILLIAINLQTLTKEVNFHNFINPMKN